MKGGWLGVSELVMQELLALGPHRPCPRLQSAPGPNLGRGFRKLAASWGWPVFAAVGSAHRSDPSCSWSLTQD